MALSAPTLYSCMVDTSKASNSRDGLLDFRHVACTPAGPWPQARLNPGQPHLPRLLFLLPLRQRAQNLILDAADEQHQAALLRVDGCELALRLPGKLLGPRFNPGAELLEWPREPLQGRALLFRLNALGRVGKVPLAAGGKLRVCDATRGEQGAILQRVNHGKGRDGRGVVVIRPSSWTVPSWLTSVRPELGEAAAEGPLPPSCTGTAPGGP